MILIADSGATKTDWCYGTANGACIRVQTEGINPFHQSAGHIRHILESQLAPRCAMPAEACTEVFFYGAGCLPSVSGPVAEALHRLFPEAHVEVETDLLGAARALCQYRPGIACILGTGSNSCLYDGERITQNVSPWRVIGLLAFAAGLVDRREEVHPRDLVDDFSLAEITRDDYTLTQADMLWLQGISHGTEDNS